MALEGSLSDFGLADIMQLIYFQKKTGVLTLKGKPGSVRIVFFEGNIISVEPGKKGEDNRIAKVFLKKGLINDPEFVSVLEEQERTGGRIPEIILKRMPAQKEEIAKVVSGLITEMTAQLFAWKVGDYEFEQQPLQPDRDLSLALDTQHVMMDSLRILDEWTLIEGRVTLDTLFLKKGLIEGALSIEEESVLKYVDGENDAGMIIDMSGMDDFHASKALVSLMDKGVIEAVETAPLIVDETSAPVRRGDKKESLWSILPAAALTAGFILSLIASPILDSSSGEMRKAVRDIEGLRSLAEEHRFISGEYPELNSLNAGKDPWGRPYVYKTEAGGVVIFSMGPDGKKDTNDDIF